MADSSVKYRVIPSDDSQASHSDYTGLTSARDDPDYQASEFAAEARAKWTYFLLGCAILLPWNAMINATPFFLSRLAGSPFYSSFSSSLSCVYTLTILVFQLYSTVTSKQSIPSLRIFMSIISMILLITSLCLSTFIRGTPSGFFLLALFVTASLAVAVGYMYTAVYAGASLLGAPFLQAVISGQAAVAVVVSAVQVASSIISLWDSSLQPVSLAVVSPDVNDGLAEETAARIFFGVSVIFLSIPLAAYTWMAKQPFYKSLVVSPKPHRLTGDTDESAGLVANNRPDTPAGSNSQIYRVFRQNAIFMFSAAYVFAVTLAIYPAISVRVGSVNPAIHPLLFTAVHFLVFNTGDLVGRYSCTFPRMVVWSARKILAMALLRTLFIPLILLCNVHPPETSLPVSPMICSDILFMAIMLAIGYTNGYVASLALVAVSSLEHNPRLHGRREDVDVAATLGGSFVTVGLALGALCSFGVQAMT